MTSLANSGVLVTRPETQADAIVAAIEAAGGTAFRFPVLDITGRPIEEVRAENDELPRPDIIIFVSSNAVQHGLAAFDDESAQIAAVGPATRDAIEASGHRVDILAESGFDSEHLLETEALRDVDGRTVRIVRGNGGRELLAETLRERGARVDYLEVYRRGAHQFGDEELRALGSAWDAGEVHSAIAMSVDSLRFLLAALPEACRNSLHKVALVTPSKRVIQTALDETPDMTTVLARGPGTEEILEALAESQRTARSQSNVMSDTDDKPAQHDAAADGNSHETAKAADDLAAGDTDAPAGDVAEDSREEKPPAQPAAASKPTKSSRFSPVAWLALLVSLAALAGVGWLWKTGNEAPETSYASESSVNAVSRSLESTEATISDLQSRLAGIANADGDQRAELAALERQFQDSFDDMASVPGRLANLEGSISSLQGISSGVRDTWLLAEAEYYLQIANAQLQLAGNPHLASLALRLADEKILALANPSLTNVRRAISDELRAIDTMEKPDIEGITLSLASLARAVDALPLRSETSRPDSDDPAVDPELSGLDRALASLKGAMSSVVTVRQIEEAERPFVAPEAEYFLRANLSLQVQTARLALLRGEKVIFDQSIDDASAWLNDYYDTSSAGVQSALQTFEEVRGSSFSVAVPDISGSLRLLRQFTTLSEFEANAPAEPPPADVQSEETEPQQ